MIGRVALIVAGVLSGGLLLTCLPFVFASAWLRDISGWHPEEPWSDEPLRYFTPIEGVPDWLLATSRSFSSSRDLGHAHRTAAIASPQADWKNSLTYARSTAHMRAFRLAPVHAT